MNCSTPDAPIWNIESIRQGKKPHWNYIDGCMITALLEIEKITNGTELTIKLTGRLDTTTAPELEAALKESYAGVEKLVLDFAGLEYLSSAGLRVLLGAQKTMNKQGEMVVKNVNETIEEIFEITGFADVLTIE